MAYPATPKTWTAGDVLTAAQLNAELRDALLGVFPLGAGAWTAFTPVVKFGATAATIAHTCRYYRVGRLIVANYAFRFTNLNAGTGAFSMALPVTQKVITDPANVYTNAMGQGSMIDVSSGAIYTFVITESSAGFVAARSTVSPSVAMTNTAPITVVAGASSTGDEFYATVTFEAAS